MADPVSTPKTRVASFRLSLEAHQRINDQAAAAGISPRAWLDQAILANRTEIVARVRPTPDYKALIFQVNKAGNNLNQIAHRLHSLAQANIVDAQRYLAVLDALASIESALTDALAHARPH